MIKKSLLFSILLVVAVSSFAQDVLENNRPGLKWRQINTPDFRVIFPTNYEQEAQRVANILQSIHGPEGETLDSSPKKIDIILQNEFSGANGFVTLGPRRTELYTTAPQDYNFLGTNDWMTLLATHEYRHIVQYDKSKTGITGVLGILLGQYTRSAFANMAVPNWFWEGDAVLMETIYTPSGRGRIPDFDRVFRANLLEGKRYDYHKQLLGSYKDFVPNHYVHGYHFVSHLRRRTNDSHIWSDVTERTFKWPIIPFTFSFALKKYTGRTVQQNYQLMLNELDSLWRKQLEQTPVSSFETINKRKKTTYIDYSNPLPVGDEKVIVLRSGLGYIAQFVMIDNDGNEEVIHTPGYINYSGKLSLVGNTLVWNEFRYHPRFLKESYSVIESFNFELGKNKKLTEKMSRYHGAQLSPNGSQILTVEANEDGTYDIVVLDAFYGKEVKRYAGELGVFYNNPGWFPQGNKIVVVKNSSLGKAVVSIGMDNGNESEIIPPGQENIGNAFVYSHYLIYQSPYSGIDNLYALDLENGEKYQITSSKYGAYNAAISPEGEWIYYNDHSVNGLDVVRIPYNPASWIPLDKVSVTDIAYYEPLIAQEKEHDVLQDVQHEEYSVKKYSQLKGLVNVHSWGPFLTINPSEIEAGILSQNVLGTTQMYMGGVYDAYENKLHGVGRVSYQAFLPILEVEATYGQRVSNRATQVANVKFEWDERSLEGGVRIPLLLTSSAYRQSLEVGNAVGIRQVSNFRNNVGPYARLVYYDDTHTRFFTDQLMDGNFNYNRFSLSYYNLRKQSLRDIYPSFGQRVRMENYNTFGSSAMEGKLFAIRSNFYFPSLFRHHSLFINIDHQKRLDAFDGRSLDSRNYAFRNRIFKPRGYDHGYHNKYTTVSVNYTLPLFYPDWDFGPFLNLKRFRANLFYDYGKGEGRGYYLLTSEVLDNNISQLWTSNYTKDVSVGTELLVDFNFMRLPIDLSVGGRFVYATRTSESRFEFIIGNIGF